jgi:hypothetical protein
MSSNIRSYGYAVLPLLLPASKIDWRFFVNVMRGAIGIKVSPQENGIQHRT